MSIPATQNTTGKYNSFNEKVSDSVFRLLNNTGGAVAQGDYKLIHGMLGLVLSDAADGEYFDLRVSDEMEIQVDDLKSGADTFATIYQPVFFNETNQEFDDTGFGIMVGQLSEVKDSAGTIKFFNVTKRVPLGGEMTLRYEIDADASSGIDVDFGFNFEIVDVRVTATATSGSGTVTLQDSAGNAISDAIVAATADAVTRAGSLDGTEKTITDGIVKVITNGASDRAIVDITVRPALS